MMCLLVNVGWIQATIGKTLGISVMLTKATEHNTKKKNKKNENVSLNSFNKIIKRFIRKSLTQGFVLKHKVTRNWIAYCHYDDELQLKYFRIYVKSSLGNSFSRWMFIYWDAPLLLFMFFLNKVFEGNTDPFLVVSHLLKNPINVTRYIRIYPVAWKNGISLRADFYGCKSGTLDYTIIFHCLLSY